MLVRLAHQLGKIATVTTFKIKLERSLRIVALTVIQFILTLTENQRTTAQKASRQHAIGRAGARFALRLWPWPWQPQTCRT